MDILLRLVLELEQENVAAEVDMAQTLAVAEAAVLVAKVLTVAEVLVVLVPMHTKFGQQQLIPDMTLVAAPDILPAVAVVAPDRFLLVAQGVMAAAQLAGHLTTIKAVITL